MTYKPWSVAEPYCLSLSTRSDRVRKVLDRKSKKDEEVPHRSGPGLVVDSSNLGSEYLLARSQVWGICPQPHDEFLPRPPMILVVYIYRVTRPLK